MGKNDAAWEKAFEDLNILDEIEKNGIFEVGAKQLIKYREPRLMCKADTSGQRPEIFQKNHLNILPNTRGSYIIGRFDNFTNLSINDHIPIETIHIPNYIRTFDKFAITSESNALNVAYISGVFDEIVGNNTFKFLPTISGRLGTGEFDFLIDGYKVNVKNSQMEIDASFENDNSVVLIEAKNRIPIDFNIRQLYYPYRYYHSLVRNKKIYPIFMTYSNSIYHFHVYEFKEAMDMKSIRKIGQKNFIINKSLNLSNKELMKIYKSVLPEDDLLNIPFPQADSITRIMAILDAFDKDKTNDELSEEMGLVTRQGQYYMRAMEYLGLVEKYDNNSRLTSFGKTVKAEEDIYLKNILLIKSILKKRIFRDAFIEYLLYEEINKNKTVRKLMELYKINDTTAQRRFNTIKSWIEWIFSFTNIK
ncbi:hypothetical protein U1299_06740 [Enterococcus cecorum]|uniref:Translation elongation factor n=3 Tax=Enterococcus cecorum TaxID=44008 RepID=A0AAW9JLL3_9ENTE|nr:hypothetical protein [Enterococcus cecorum]MDZ5504332.1 hypothetical protein [Enterococcus cecorum]MDZ5531817.1 hypothetical protein [Enterococcus cecorum]MDZ5545265.1 hypothetical protein [Enterococcus cecorum]MDZ5550157.1 hypothetical protein [Enterococcus cecorum]MDZ5552115.1 hypothetical protein [Enterococcus cecorum]